MRKRIVPLQDVIVLPLILIATVIAVITGSAHIIRSAKEKGAPASAELKQVTLYEHSVFVGAGIGGISDLPEYDESGFYTVSDTVYVKSSTLNLRSGAGIDADLVATVTYGTPLSRIGVGPNGWDRIYFEGDTVYASRDYLTDVEIGEEQNFEFSQAMLSIVDTSRQIYSYDSMCVDLRELRERYGEHMQLNVIGNTKDNRSIYEVVIGNPDAERQILLVAGLCGAEYMTSLVAMKQMEYYLCYYEGGNYNGFRYQDLFDRVAIRVIPMANPDGVTISQEYLSSIRSDEMQADLTRWFERDQTGGGTSLSLENYLMFFYANGNGVDLRKQFDYNFENIESAAAPGATGYKGEAPATEPEAKALLHSARGENVIAVVVYHTSGSTVRYHYGNAEAEAAALAKRLSDSMSYACDESSVGAAGYGSFEGYADTVLQKNALSVALGNGAAPLSLNEFSAIWDACRESWAAMQTELLPEP